MIKHSKRGDEHTYSVKDVGREIRVHVSEKGYRLRATAEIKFEALSDRQSQGIRTMLHNAIDEALRTAAMQRHENVPLFDLDFNAGPTTTQGVNEL